MSKNKLGRRIAAQIARGIDNWSEFTGLACAVGIFVSTVIIVHEVIVRYMRIATIWETELAIYLLMMAAYVGAAYGLKHGGHIHIDIITNLLSPRHREVLLLITSVLGMVIAGVIAWYSWPVWWEAYEAGYHSQSLWAPPLVFPYILLPLGMSFLTIHYFVHIARKITLVRDLSRSQQEHEPSP
jgi:C4-dicarboxylate transporter DctQ subunit